MLTRCCRPLNTRSISRLAPDHQILVSADMTAWIFGVRLGIAPDASFFMLVFNHWWCSTRGKKGGNQIHMKHIVLLTCAVLLVSAVHTSAQNYKIRQSTDIGGQKMESTVYVKGARKRTENAGIMGMGADVADIEQCDLKRNVKVNDKKKLYRVEPFATADEPASAAPAPRPTATPVKQRKGGTITMTSVITDTGERKQMFGLTARRIKTSMTSQSSPDACTQSNMKFETDGWYIDLPAFSCPMELTQRDPMPAREPRNDCTDNTIVKQSGSGRLGFALEFMQTMTDLSGGSTFTQSMQTLEFSRSSLPDSLFDVPAGYTAVNDSSQLYGQPDMAAIMAQMGAEDKPAKSITSSPVQVDPQVKKPGIVRIGVMVPTNRGDNISTASMQAFLAQKLTSGNIEGFPVTSEAEAKAANCDYILTGEFSKLKQSTASKIGGMFGKVTGADTSSVSKYDAEFSFNLVKLADGKSVLKNKVSAKTESEVDRAAEGVLVLAAAAIGPVAK